jgi:hypothetical protein
LQFIRVLEACVRQNRSQSDHYRVLVSKLDGILPWLGCFEKRLGRNLKIMSENCGTLFALQQHGPPRPETKAPIHLNNAEYQIALKCQYLESEYSSLSYCINLHDTSLPLFIAEPIIPRALEKTIRGCALYCRRRDKVRESRQCLSIGGEIVVDEAGLLRNTNKLRYIVYSANVRVLSLEISPIAVRQTTGVSTDSKRRPES